MRKVNPGVSGEKIGGSCVPFMSGLPPSPDADTQDRLTLTKPYPGNCTRTRKGVKQE